MSAGGFQTLEKVLSKGFFQKPLKVCIKPNVSINQRLSVLQLVEINSYFRLQDCVRKLLKVYLKWLHCIIAVVVFLKSVSHFKK